MTKRYVLVVALTLAAFVGAIYLTKAPLLAYIDLPSAAMVLVPAVLMGFAAHTPRQVARCYRVAFRGETASREELADAAAYFDALTRYLACAGAIGVLVGGVALLLLISDLATVRRGIALCLISGLYAVVLIALVAVPFRTAVRRRLAASQP